MSNTPNPAYESPDRSAIRTPAALGLLVILVLELLALVAVTLVLIVDVFAGGASSESGGIALAILALITTLWVAFMCIGLVRARPWVRSGIVVWEFILVAIGIGAFQGVFRVPSIGWALLIPAVIALVLVFLPPVTRLLARDPERDREPEE
ncbi:hypothetical protein [Curtobacterium ammoniigenes]|uniref:hypothetical protein n=1 Tax=Curtobacterium ammoniigenes TaxID=395387 RepID=UPI00082B4E96|nr:hypothetical protein [Curtobacterium ammoniigenes]